MLRTFSLGAALAITLAAQPPAFEVVSVKHRGDTSKSVQTGPGEFMSLTRWWKYTPTRVSCNLSLANLVEEAYSIREWQLSSPEWVGHETYDFAATMPEGTSRANARLMLRAVLAERFQLRLRREQKEFSTYDLVVGKGGFKSKEVPRAEGGTFGYSMGSGRYEAQAITLRAFADWLTSIAGRPVFDKTGLTATYDIKLEWSPNDVPQGPVLVIGKDAGALSALAGIGLRLEAARAMFDYYIVEQAEKEPTEN